MILNLKILNAAAVGLLGAAYLDRHRRRAFLGLLALAAAALGWSTRTVESPGDAELAELLGVAAMGEGPEAELPELLLRIETESPGAGGARTPLNN